MNSAVFKVDLGYLGPIVIKVRVFDSLWLDHIPKKGTHRTQLEETHE